MLAAPAGVAVADAGGSLGCIESHTLSRAPRNARTRTSHRGDKQRAERACTVAGVVVTKAVGNCTWLAVWWLVCTCVSVSVSIRHLFLPLTAAFWLSLSLLPFFLFPSLRAWFSLSPSLSLAFFIDILYHFELEYIVL